MFIRESTDDSGSPSYLSHNAFQRMPDHDQDLMRTGISIVRQPTIPLPAATSHVTLQNTLSSEESRHQSVEPGLGCSHHLFADGQGILYLMGFMDRY